jgi:glycosyltransferase involved in cell wall biosynthesis
MRGASVFVLSSAWEGFGNVLAEALSLGVPVVSTDCPYGPREILQGGRLGRLVPVGEPAALAKAMADTLDDPPPAEPLIAGALRFTRDASGAQYLRLLLAQDPG